MEVNGLSNNEADKYIKDAFDLFKNRSTEKWEMNLSLIDEYLN